MKKFVIAILFVLLGCLLCLPAAAADDSFNPKLTVDRTAEAAGSFTITVSDSSVLAEKQPTLRLPCAYASVTVIMPNGTPQAGSVAGGQVSFKVTMGGTYTITNADPAKMLTGIAIKTQPKLNYTEGETLDLSAMVVTASYVDGSTVPLAYTDVSTSIAHGAELELSHNGMVITVSYGGKTAATNALTVKESTKPAPEPEPEPDYWLMVLLNLYNRTFNFTVNATEGGEIEANKEGPIKYGTNVTYTITPDEGYTIEAVLVDGKNVGAVGEYTFKKVRRMHEITVIFAPIVSETP
ncbi:MAG: bacterial Ig-like domain-containing protein [Clostridia bacterium]|nr:bacterial Ig-like domain-containing protein [Clostridia bacterium]